jgi:hypothetical protein
MFAQQGFRSMFTDGPWTRIDTEGEFATALRMELSFASHLTWECATLFGSDKPLALVIIAPADVNVPWLDREPYVGVTPGLIEYRPRNHREVASLFAEEWVGRVVAYPFGLNGGIAISIYTEEEEWEVLVDRARVGKDDVGRIRELISLCALRDEIVLEPFPDIASDYVQRRFANTGFDKIIPA